MTTLSRKATLPIVCGVWLATLLVAVHTSAILPWFLHYYDFYQQRAVGIEYPVAVRLFHQGYPIGVPLALSIVGYGIYLLRPAERRLHHILWFAIVSIGLATTWLVWTSLVKHAFYELLFPA